jgi:hypothetical protein
MLTLRCRTPVRSSLRRFTSTLPRNMAPGSLLVWGKVDMGRLGIKIDQQNYTSNVGMTQNPFLHDVAQVVCNSDKTIALTKDGSVYSWGTCPNFSLGQGDDTRTIVKPKKVDALAGIRIVQIASGETSTAAVSADGDLYTWGWGGSWLRGNGGLGHGDETTQPRPALVQSLEVSGTKMLQVAVGSQVRQNTSLQSLDFTCKHFPCRTVYARPDNQRSSIVVGQRGLWPSRQRLIIATAAPTS